MRTRSIKLLAPSCLDARRPNTRTTVACYYENQGTIWHVRTVLNVESELCLEAQQRISDD